MRFEKLVREWVLTSSPSAVGPIWAAILLSILLSLRSCILPPHSSPPFPSTDARPLAWAAVVARSGNTLPAHPDPWCWAARQWALSLLSSRPRTGEQQLLSTLGCRPAVPPQAAMLVVPGGCRSRDQHRHSSIMNYEYLSLPPLLCMQKSISRLLRSRSAELPSSPSLLSPSPAFTSSPSLVSSQPLMSHSLSLPSPSLFPPDRRATHFPHLAGHFGEHSSPLSNLQLILSPPGDGFHKAAGSAEVRRLPALALTCIPALKIMDTMENQWRICNFIPFIASYCITPRPSGT